MAPLQSRHEPRGPGDTRLSAGYLTAQMEIQKVEHLRKVYDTISQVALLNDIMRSGFFFWLRMPLVEVALGTVLGRWRGDRGPHCQ